MFGVGMVVGGRGKPGRSFVTFYNVKTIIGFLLNDVLVYVFLFAEFKRIISSILKIIVDANPDC